MTTTYDFGDPAYLDTADVREELDRVFDLCHGCRLCWDLCPSFASLFDLIDTKTDGLDVRLPAEDQDRVVDECYQCKLCYVKCPYIPPHEWDLDFPRLMMRALAASTGGKSKSLGAKLLAATDMAGKAATATSGVANASLRANSVARKAMGRVLGIAPQRELHPYAKQRFTTWWKKTGANEPVRPFATAPPEEASEEKARPSFLEPTEDELAAETARVESPRVENEEAAPETETDPVPSGRPEAPPREVTIFPTCVVEYMDPAIGIATARVLRHNGCDVRCSYTRCCGMPDLDAGDIRSFREKAERNVADLLPEVRAGRLIVVPEPTCNYTLRKEYPHYLDTDEAREVGAAVVDPAEYLLRLRRAEGIAEDFTSPLGQVAYHAACHLRAQQQGYKGRDVLQLVPDTQVKMIEGCAGIDGTWGYHKANYDMARAVAGPTADKMRAVEADLHVGDCTLADQALVEEGVERPLHSMQALARAYGLEESP
ncbi:MAG: 4Fe-4S dicluster domain-containing protein [Acidimicrobiia bacterium]|nr:4Fe-4S dicluster domain-containing protein [Acidimicrobiia bacterium]